jgi:hypothetical protein
MATGGVNFGSCDSFGGFDMKTDPTDPMQGDDFRLEPRSWEHAAAMAPQSRAKWGRCILYADASWPRTGPAFDDWRHDLFGAGRFSWSPECEDYAVWAINEFLKRGVLAQLDCLRVRRQQGWPPRGIHVAGDATSEHAALASLRGGRP